MLCSKTPERSPSIQDYPACDETVRSIAKELWGSGKIITNTNLNEVLDQLQTSPDVIAPPELVWKHRRDGDSEIYFLANQIVKPLRTKVSFRVVDRGAELWNPVTGERRPLPQVRTASGGRAEIDLEFVPNESYFVIFGGETGSKDAKGANFPSYKSVQEVTGAWDVQFDPQWFYPDNGTGGKVTFEKLEDWTQRPEEAVKYFSGVATYRKTFTFTPAAGGSGALFLDLGQVNDLAKVRLNGQELGTLWTWPYRLPVGNALKSGQNILEIEMINPWINRLLGDDTLPEAQRKTYLTTPRTIYQVSKGVSPLAPSGLIGPIRVMVEQ